MVSFHCLDYSSHNNFTVSTYTLLSTSVDLYKVKNTQCNILKKNYTEFVYMFGVEWIEFRNR